MAVINMDYLEDSPEGEVHDSARQTGRNTRNSRGLPSDLSRWHPQSVCSGR